MTRTQQLQNLVQLPIKDRIKQSRTLAYQIAQNMKAITIDECESALEIMNIAIKYAGSPEKMIRDRAKLIAYKLSLLGITEVSILQKKRFTLQVESGVIAVGDSAMLDATFVYSNEKDLIEKTLTKGFAFALDGDQTVSVEVRIVGAPEPMLAPKEYSKLLSSTKQHSVKINQVIVIDDLNAFAASKNKIEVESADYLAAAYLIGKPGNTKICIVFTRAAGATNVVPAVQLEVLSE